MATPTFYKWQYAIFCALLVQHLRAGDKPHPTGHSGLCAHACVCLCMCVSLCVHVQLVVGLVDRKLI